MVAKLKKIYKRFKKDRMMKIIRPYTVLSEESFYGDGFSVELRSPEQEHIYLTVGDHCIVDGSFVFEKASGYVRLGDRVHIGGSTFISVNEIIIEDDVTIAWDCLFYDHNSHSVFWEERKEDTEQEYMDLKAGLSSIANKDWSVVKSAPIRICSKAWIGTGVKVLKGVTIGEGAVVGAGSVVTRDVPPWTVVGGNPAVVLRTIQELENEQ